MSVLRGTHSCPHLLHVTVCISVLVLIVLLYHAILWHSCFLSDFYLVGLDPMPKGRGMRPPFVHE